MKSVSHKIINTVFYRVRDRANYVTCYEQCNNIFCKICDDLGEPVVPCTNSYIGKWRKLEGELYEQIYAQKIVKITDQVCFQINRTV
jgi:hypothetical protein